MEDPREELRRQAEALGVEVDGRWGEETLREKIAEAKANEEGQGDAEDSKNGATEEGNSSSDGEGPTGDVSEDQPATTSIDEARAAMTAPIRAAFSAASAMGNGAGYSAAWFAGEAEIADYLPALVDRAVPFVRQWPDAPVEALYSDIARAVPALGHTRPWADLEVSDRLAWEVFRDVLVKTDAAIAAEAERASAEGETRSFGAWHRDEDDTMFAPATSREQRSDLGRARDRAAGPRA